MTQTRLYSTQTRKNCVGFLSCQILLALLLIDKMAKYEQWIMIFSKSKLNYDCYMKMNKQKTKKVNHIDELKSHPFSVHFSDRFLYKKGLIYMQKCGITHQTAMQQEIQEKEDIAVEGAESGGAGMTRLAE